MAERIVGRMNILAIKSVDPYAKEIVGSSDHVAVYSFNHEKNLWDKTQMEGALIIYSRFAEPYHSLTVYNKINTQLFVEPITSRMKLKVETPFMFCGNEQKMCKFYEKFIWVTISQQHFHFRPSGTRCFRFDSKDECNRLFELLDRILQSSIQFHSQQSNKNVGVGIFAMLANAQENFNSGAGVGTAQPNKQFHNNSANTTANASPSVMSFFAAAKPASADVPVYKTMSSEPVHVDQIEQRQRNITPREKKHLPPQESNNIPHLSATFQPIPSPNLNKFPFANASKATTSTRINATFSGSSNTTNVNPSELLQKSMQNMRINMNNDRSVTANGTKPTLMSPTMFLMTKQSPGENGDSMLPHTTTNDQLPSNMAQTKTSEVTPEPLTPSQLLQAMSHLIKTDGDFVKKLHEAYLQSFNEMLT